MAEISTAEKHKYDFQTPKEVCSYMASLIPDHVVTVLEPNCGAGNLVKALEKSGFEVTAPEDYFLLEHRRFDAVCLNPPFSSKYAFMENAPIGYSEGGMRLGYQILLDCMKMADHVIALMPWFTLSDSDVRLRYLKRYGMKSLTALPRKTFQYARIQTVVIELEKGYQGETEFRVYDLLNQSEDIFAGKEAVNG